ncbi:MAG: hypothetical protein JJE04_00550 [Acidobacteriia bacterium]|nr:hypothetical protein [Terriglobia bacterium]
MAVAAAPFGDDSKSILDRMLGLTGDVRNGEGTTALLMALNGFLILAAYYVIRPLRDAFLLPVKIDIAGTLLTGPEIRQYTGGILAALFLFVVPAYGALASKVNRIKLINTVTLFFVANLVIFYLAANGGTPGAGLGITFYLWMGIFNLMVVAQFWALANDIYTPEEGKRLFAIVGFGASAGAIFGSIVIRGLIRPLGLFLPMLISGAILLLCLVLTNIIHVRERDKARSVAASRAAEKPLGTDGGFQLVFRQKYLLLIGVLTLIAQYVNTNGNYILTAVLNRAAEAAVADGTAGGLNAGQFIGAFQADVDLYQNILVVLIQLFLVARIFKWVGVGPSLFFLPMVALFSYGLFVAAPVLALIRIAKITENATDYSLQNTARRALFLPTSREAKYKALQAVETFFWRSGDMFSAVTTLVIVQVLALSERQFAGLNLAMVAIWMIVAFALAKENKKLMASQPASAE